ncbi:MAG: hypothetical protein JJU28_12710 [Cyclobacteriaceae bacterium]|nr:hypothetical protein [Cyclobacteriaceae bacterium]
MIGLKLNFKWDSTAMVAFALMLFISACDIEDSQPKVDAGFLRIYDDGTFETRYFPVDMVQTPDSGFAILSAENDWQTYFMKVDKQGNFEWEIHLPDKYVNPIRGMYLADSVLHFYCMDKIALGTYLLQVSPLSGQVQELRFFPSLLYPLAAKPLPDRTTLLLSYNRDETSSRFSKISSTFAEQWGENYNVFQDVEEDLIIHLKRLGRRIPFFVGASQSRYFWNGFYNFNLSLVFSNPSNGAETGLISGFRSQSGMSAALPLEGNRYFFTRFNFNEHFIINGQSINENSIQFGGDLASVLQPEIRDQAQVFVSDISIRGSSYRLMATDTKRGQILLAFYDASATNLLGLKYLGRNNPYEIAGLTKTLDGGLAVLGTTYLAGRFPRICLFKISPRELEDVVLTGGS